MKNYFLIFALISLISCTAQNKSVKNKDTSNCAVPQEGQNDDFLKGIDELKQYSWNDETKEAKITLENGEELIVTHGGCIHFIVSAEFHPKQKINMDNDYQEVFSKVLWITSLLKDFNHNLLKEAISTKNYQVVTNQYVTTILFNDEFLKKKFYTIIINTKVNTFAVSQFLQ